VLNSAGNDGRGASIKTETPVLPKPPLRIARLLGREQKCCRQLRSSLKTENSTYFELILRTIDALIGLVFKIETPSRSRRVSNRAELRASASQQPDQQLNVVFGGRGWLRQLLNAIRHPGVWS
jgi:hypothetical protein